MVPLPLLCDCRRHNGFVAHSDQRMTYIHWCIAAGAECKNVIFLQRCVLELASYKGRTLKQLLDYKTPDEACRMISRDFLRSVKCAPDYVVIVHDAEMGRLSCLHSMDGILTDAARSPSVANIKRLAEGGDGGEHNLLGKHLTDIAQDMVAKGYYDINH